MMVKHNIGVRLKMRYEVKRIDEGYFDLEYVICRFVKCPLDIGAVE